MIMRENYPKTQEKADVLLAVFGEVASLRRIGPEGPASLWHDRPCLVVVEAPELDRSDRRVLMSPLDPFTEEPLEIPPDSEQDQLVTYLGPHEPELCVIDEVLLMTSKPSSSTGNWEFTVQG